MPSKTCVLVAVIAVVALVVALGLGLGLTLGKSNADSTKPSSSTLGDCMPEGDQNEPECAKRGCIWNVRSDLSPNCTFPDRYGYQLVGDVQHYPFGLTAVVERLDQPSIYGNDVRRLRINVTYQTKQRVRVKIYDDENVRYEVPKEAVDITFDDRAPSDVGSLDYVVEIAPKPHVGVWVKRRGTGTVIFDTTSSGLVFSDQYIQLTTALPSDSVYGFGEHVHGQFKHDMNWRKWIMFARDQPPGGPWNLYGSQTHFMNIDDSGNAHGVFLLNSNAFGVVLQPKPNPAVTYHVIGGILDFYIFLGPTPENVVQQYTEAVGRTFMPPYWALGFQLSRYDYKNLSNVRQVVERNRMAGIPQDVQFGDIDYMESRFDFTYDRKNYAGLPAFVNELHELGQKYIIILDPAIGSNRTLLRERLNGSYAAYEEGLNGNVFIRDPRNASRMLEGSVWPGLSVFPDFTLGENVSQWWTKHCQIFYNDSVNFGIKYDALWIDMNEPASFVQGSTTGCAESKYNTPPFNPYVLINEGSTSLTSKTICMDAQQHWGRHYDVHNLYGHSWAIVTYETLRSLFPSKRPFVLSRSNFASTHKYAAHWLGDNASQWPQLAWSIVGMLEYSLFGYAYTGADICGFFDDATEEMCQRWMQLGAFYPFSRNHNGQNTRDQDPAAFSQAMSNASRDVLMIRYKLLPFLYTLIHMAHTAGNTVVRPLLHEFTSDKNTWSIDRQFLWGPSLLISPVLDQGATNVRVYFPQGRWFDYHTGTLIESDGKHENLGTPLDHIQLHVRGGYIIPWQEPANTTVYSRRNPMGLIVATGPSPSYHATGMLFWDDGESFDTYERNQFLLLNFESNATSLVIQVRNATYRDPYHLAFDTIDVLGLGGKIQNLTVNGQPRNSSFVEYNQQTKNNRLINVGLAIIENHHINWEVER